MWTDLVKAYESKLAVLEEARAAYAQAVGDVIGHVGLAMEAAVRDVFADVGGEYRIEALIETSDSNAVLTTAPWSRTTIIDDSTGVEFRIAAWVASTWGGPDRTLRIALSLEGLHSWLSLEEWISKSGAFMGDAAPGEPFDALDWKRFPETSPEWRTIRIASIELDDRDFRQVATESREVARAFAEPLIQLFALINEAGLPISNAERALLRYRDTLGEKAERAGVNWGPSKNLGSWGGGKYLQVGQFWLATDPAANRLIAACNKNDNEIVSALAEKLGHATGRHAASLCVAILDEEELRNGQDIDAEVAAAFDFWFMAKASELCASGAESIEESDLPSRLSEQRKSIEL